MRERERKGEREKERVENDESRKINYDSNWILLLPRFLFQF